MTDRVEILGCIKDFYEAYGYYPSQRELAETVGIALSGINRYLHILEAEGRIKFLPVGGRNIRVIERKP